MSDRPNCATINELPSKTEKSHRIACNINTIMARAKRGIATPLRSGGIYGDFSSVPEYQEALQRVVDAKNDFEALPAEIRKRFRNDPAELIRFVTDDANIEEAIALGLIPKPEPETPEPEPEPEPVE